MDINLIKKVLPHVDKIWVKGGEWFIHYVPDAEVITETTIKDAPKQIKKK